ncbi:MAG: hypothetical protein NXI14_13270 [bacterium]|nr:hypothetical protein [bacterium]
MSGMRRWLLGTLLWCAGVMAMNSIAEVPWWDADPLLSDLPETSLTPGQALLICTIGLLASTGLLVGGIRRGEVSRLALVVVGAVATGGLGVILHGLVLPPLASVDAVRGDLEGLVPGATWVTGVFGGFALATLKPRGRVLRLVLGVFVVLGVLMVAKALFERFVELPRTIELFELERERVLLANGLEPGSAPAEIYERRLRSQEPTAWFGLANVLASFLAAMTVLLLASAVRAFADVRAGRCSSGGAGLVGLVGLATAVSLWLTGSKGAMAVLLLVLGGGLAVGVSGQLRMAVRARPGVAIASTGVVVLAGVVGRGLLLPESLERSVLFRWHYLVGTFRVWMENVLVGAGPGGFQDAYTRLKPAISPESVQSPHVLLADWVGAFGLLGFVVVAGLTFWLWSAESLNRGLEPDAAPGRGELAWCLLVGTTVLVTSLSVQWRVVGGVADLLLVLAIGFGIAAATLGVLLGLWRRHPAWLGWSAVAAASVLIGHGMFDVAPARANSAMLFWLLVGVGVGPLRGSPARVRRWFAPGVLIAMLVAGALAVAGVRQVAIVEPALAKAARMANANSGEFTFPGDSSGRSPSSVVVGLLDDASDASPGWLKLDLARFRFESRVAATRGGLADLVWDSDRIGERWTRSVEVQSAIGATLWSFGADPAYGPAFRAKAVDASVRAAKLAPHDAQPAYRAAILLQAVGRDDEALDWAERAFVNQRQQRLDPLAGLLDEQLLRLRRGFPGVFSDRAGSADGAGGGD